MSCVLLLDDLSVPQETSREFLGTCLVQLVEIFFTNAAAGVADGQSGDTAIATLLPHTLTHLYSGMRSAQLVAAAPDTATAASIAAFATCAARAWCRVLLHAVPLYTHPWRRVEALQMLPELSLPS